MSNVINIRDFRANERERVGDLVPIRGSICDHLASRDPGLDSRANELLSEAEQVIKLFPSETVAEMLAYAAARLERFGYVTFK